MPSAVAPSSDSIVAGSTIWNRRHACQMCRWVPKSRWCSTISYCPLWRMGISSMETALLREIHVKTAMQLCVVPFESRQPSLYHSLSIALSISLSIALSDGKVISILAVAFLEFGVRFGRHLRDWMRWNDLTPSVCLVPRMNLCVAHQPRSLQYKVMEK